MATDIHARSHYDFRSSFRPYDIHYDIDYNKDIRATFEFFSRACRGNFARILHSACERRQIQIANDWPTWLPDWRCPPTRLLPFKFFNWDDLYLDGRSTASKLQAPADKITLRIKNCPWELNGHTLSVERISDVPVRQTFVEDFCLNVRKFFEGYCIPASDFVRGGVLFDWWDSKSSVFRYFQNRLISLWGFDTGPNPYVPRDEQQATELNEAACRALEDKCWFATTGDTVKFMGVEPSELEIGDQVIIGDCYPTASESDRKPSSILRPASEGNYFLVGFASIQLHYGVLSKTTADLNDLHYHVKSGQTSVYSDNLEIGIPHCKAGTATVSLV
ncbi:hypothetical protein BDV96DRAFT_654720 [Lophiotrema nucula]|uniref:Uncharacterized protein n=1 Tax=Lophiotrema nucula TaxID=690887 RepID=A0A6A5YGD4_9PLEO|nr:hypothetical protein BDV96DRAFT_654720 [Lophiotrema nucula]